MRRQAIWKAKWIFISFFTQKSSDLNFHGFFFFTWRNHHLFYNKSFKWNGLLFDKKLIGRNCKCKWSIDTKISRLCNSFSYLGFLSQTLAINTTAWERRRPSLFPFTYKHSKIYLQFCVWDGYLLLLTLSRSACNY